LQNCRIAELQKVKVLMTQGLKFFEGFKDSRIQVVISKLEAFEPFDLQAF
jgi:hypothetical protein